MNIQETRLANGLQILTWEQHQRPLVSAMLWYRVGSRNEETGRTGISHFLEHLLFKGSRRYPKGAIDLLTLRNGGNNNAFTWIDATAYFFNFASDRWEEALEVEADRMRNCLFVPEEVEAEREVILSEWRSGKDTPEENLFDLVNGTAIQAHPYHNPIIGWFQDIEHVTRQEIIDYYNRYYHPNNATLILVGDFETPAVLKKIKKLFGSIPATPELPQLRVQEPPQEGERRVVLHKADIQLPRLQVAFRSPAFDSPDFYALSVLDHMLTYGFSSLLHQQLVEHHQVATDVGSYYYPTRDPYLLTIGIDVPAGIATDLVEQRLYKEIERIQRGQVAPEHLSRAQHQILADHYFQQETYENQANFLGMVASIGDWRQAQNYVAALQAVTLDDVVRVAKQYLQPSQRTVGWLLPPTTKKRSRSATAGHHHGLQPAYYRQPAAASPTLNSKSYPKLQVPPVQRYQLSNGLRLLIQENHQLPTVTIKAFVGVGSLHESAEQAGLAYLTAESLMKGTQSWNSKALVTAIESLGGKLGTSMNSVGTTIYLKTLAADVEQALPLLSDMLRRATFPKAEVEKEKQQVMATLMSHLEDPQQLARQAFKRLIYGTHPAARVCEGTLATVPRLTRRDVQQFYQTWYVPNQTMIALVGDLDGPNIKAQIESLLGDWQFQAVPEMSFSRLKRQTKTKIRHLKANDKEQSHIYLGHLGIPRRHPDYVALQVMDYVLGWGPGITARIPARLRDEEGLAYTTYSTMVSSANIYPGMFIAYMGTKPDNTERAITGLRREIGLLRAEGCSDSEVADAKAYLNGSLIFNFETNGQWADFWLENEFFGLGPDYLKRYWEQLQAVTAQDIQRVASQWLDENNYSLVIAGAAP